MKNLNTYIRFLVLACIFIIPMLALYVSNWSFFPFIVGKNLAFRGLVEIAFGGWLLLVLFGSLPKPRLTPITISIGLFVGIVALADASGVAPFKSFWSNFERMDGLVTLLHAFMFFIVAGSVLNTHKLWLRFWQVSLAVSMIVGFGALATLSDTLTRIAGTTGNPIYLAVYALFHMFIAGLLAYKSRSTTLHWVYGLTIFFNLMVLWYTGTRGALLGLIAGVIVMALGIVFLSKDINIWVKRTAIGGIIALVLLTGGFIAMRDTDFVQDNTMLHRLSELGNLDETDRSTSALRLMVWKTALEGVKERPILGWGQENFNYVFNKYHNPHMYWAEAWYDRTHNILLDWLIAAGVLGLFAYLAMYVIIFIESIRARYFGSVETSIFAGLLAAYAVHNLFVFDHVISYILFFSLAAWLHSVDSIEHDTKESSIEGIDGTGLGLAALIIIPVSTVMMLYMVNYPSYAQNKTIIQALVKARNPQTIDQAREYFIDAASYEATGTQEAREQFIQAASMIASVKEIDSATKSKFVNDAIAQMQEQMKAYPKDARFPHFIGGVLSSYGEHERAMPFLEKALALSPTKVNFLITLGSNAAIREDFNAAHDYYTKALSLAPENERIPALLKSIAQKIK